MRLLLPLLSLLAGAAAAQDHDPWPRAIWDPGAARSDGPEPDLVLPMPCSGAMAFQKVTVSLDATDPLADVRVRLGQTGTPSGHQDFLHYSFLRGGFDAADGRASHYFIGRYELTTGQYKALTDPDACDFSPGPRETLAQGGLSWFEALDLTRRYTEWLNANAPDALPRRDDVPGHVRLPTETEWSFAARGGEAVLPSDFSAARFPMSEPVAVYARFDAERLGPAGVSLPNPLGLYDIYGNAEEIMLEPFRMIAVGHVHGQTGGMVTRGASYLASEAEMRSAWRREWSFYGRDGKAQRQETFGMRMVIAAPVETSTQRLNLIRDAFEDRLNRGADDAGSPETVLRGIVADELDPARQATLEGLQLALQDARDRADFAQVRQLETTLLASSIFLASIWDDSDRITEFADFVAVYDAEIAAEQDGDIIAELNDYRDQLKDGAAAVAQRRDLSVEGYREMLVYLAEDVEPEPRETAFSTLDSKLGAAGNEPLREALHAVNDDRAAIGTAPDMAEQEFLEIILSR